jgi:hypothetical protein
MTNNVFLGTSLDGYSAEKDGDLDWLNEILNPSKSDYGYTDFIENINALVMRALRVGVCLCVYVNKIEKNEIMLGLLTRVVVGCFFKQYRVRVLVRISFRPVTRLTRPIQSNLTNSR